MKRIAKSIMGFVSFVFVLPLLATFHLRAVFLGRDRSLESSSQFLAILPGLTGQYLRRAFLSQVLAHCHSSSCIEFGTIFSRTGASIGSNAYIGPYCIIGLADIGQNVLLAPGVQIPSGAHTHGIGDTSVPIREQAGTISFVRIGKGSWIGSASVVMANVGDNSVVAAGSVVTKPIPDQVIAAGTPARVIQSRASQAKLEDRKETGPANPAEPSR
jgi:virginiamycin A acetyltransferase